MARVLSVGGWMGGCGWLGGSVQVLDTVGGSKTKLKDIDVGSALSPSLSPPSPPLSTSLVCVSVGLYPPFSKQICHVPVFAAREKRGGVKYKPY